MAKKKTAKKKTAKKATKKKAVSSPDNGQPTKKKSAKKKAAKKKSESKGLSDFMKELWQAAVELRGSIEPADYKRYVLPIIFLRFLSLRFERRREELEKLLGDPESDYHTTDPKVAESILEDPDEYRSAHVFIVPKSARWEALLKNAQADDIKNQLDDALEIIEDTYPEKLRGLLPRIYAGSNLDRENVTGLINLFSKDVFKQEHDGEDLIGRVYEYFIGEFASSEGKRGGEFFTPSSIVRTLVAMLEPERRIVLDPCCGSGGMFVQSDEFTKHSGRLSFYGQESKDFTYRLCKMNLFIHGVWGDIQLGNSYFDDKHDTLKADYILANPPFNDGSKGNNGWGASRVPDKDPRLKIGDEQMTLASRNANTMWILHFLYHLNDTGTAGFVMATGELSSNESARLEVRKTLIDAGLVDCVVRLPGQLFANTQIPCCLWLISRNRQGNVSGFRQRQDEVLFIDARDLGSLISGSRTQKYFSESEILQIALIYSEFKRESAPSAVPGYCYVANVSEIEHHGYALNPNRYVGSEHLPDDGEPFAERFPKLICQLEDQFTKSDELKALIRSSLKEVTDGI